MIKLLLSGLLLICLFNMPYGYYQLVRIISMIGFGYLSLKSEDSNKIIYIGLALLFQPFIKRLIGKGLVEYCRCGGGRVVDLFCSV